MWFLGKNNLINTKNMIGRKTVSTITFSGDSDKKQTSLPGRAKRRQRPNITCGRSGGGLLALAVRGAHVWPLIKAPTPDTSRYDTLCVMFDGFQGVAL